MLCAEGSIEASHLRTGQLSEEEWQNLIIAMGSLSVRISILMTHQGLKLPKFVRNVVN